MNCYSSMKNLFLLVSVMLAVTPWIAAQKILVEPKQRPPHPAIQAAIDSAKDAVCPLNIFVYADDKVDYFIADAEPLPGMGGKTRQGEENGGERAYINYRAETGGRYREFGFFFKATRDGVVRLEMGGAMIQESQNGKNEWIQKFGRLDDVTVMEGERPLDINGSFERGDKAPEGWTVSGQAMFLEDSDLARTGRRFAEVSFFQRAITSFPVKADKTYTVRAFYRSRPDPLTPPEKSEND